ncbi:MAG: DUF302 domain-containing protein [Pseudomonadota bacterium]
MHTLKLSLIVLLMACAGLAAADSTLVIRASAHDVKTTMDRLESIVRDKGLMVFARVDHAANAASVNLEMPESQLLVFGNPKAGTLIMNEDIRAGLDLPLRVLVYRDTDGATKILYRQPRALAADFDVAGNKVLGKVDQALAYLTLAAAR